MEMEMSDYCYGNVYIFPVFSLLHTTGLW